MENLTELLESLVTPRRMERLLGSLDNRLGHIRLIVENIHNPHNMSAVIRSCEAFGVQHLHVVEETEEYKIARGITKGSHKWLDIHRHRDFSECAAEVKGAGFKIYAAMLSDEAVPLEEIPITEPVALLLGNEHDGVSKAAQELCDGAYMIPMYGFVQSFNISVAAALSLYSITSRMRSELGEKAALSPEEKTATLEKWLPKSSPYAKRIARIFKEKAKG